MSREFKNGSVMQRYLQQHGLPVTHVTRKRDGVFVADFRAERPPTWDGHIRHHHHVPSAAQLTQMLRQALPDAHIVGTHESLTDWRESQADHVRFETTILFALS